MQKPSELPVSTSEPTLWRQAGRLVIVCLFLVLALKALAYVAQSPWLYWLVALPGTTLHECAHWLVAWGLQGQPSDFRIWPDWAALFQGGQYQLGAVRFQPNWYNAASVALAPLILFPLGVVLVMQALSSAKGWLKILCIYIGASSFASAWPSPADWQVAASMPTSWPLTLLLLAVGFWGSWWWLRKGLMAPQADRNKRAASNAK